MNYIDRGVLGEVLLKEGERAKFARVPDTVDLDNAELALGEHRLEFLGGQALVRALSFPLALAVLALLAAVVVALCLGQGLEAC